MASTTAPVVPTDSRKIVIKGLEKAQDTGHVDQRGDGDEYLETPTFSMIMHEEEPLSELWNRVENLGFRKPALVTIDDISHRENDPRRIVSTHEEVVVVADDQTFTNNTIRMTESLVSHANAHHGHAIDFNITPTLSSKRAVEVSGGFYLSLERTPRMPDDNKLHQLPESLESYDLFSVDAYSGPLPENIKDRGGVFFPMWQREAMWISFTPTKHKCAVRVFMGHVNTVSGLTMGETSDQKCDEREQDYIVIPGQQWLDGICVAPGVVRQFVAMPLGSGYTVEGQKTSKEQHGGLQLEITPEFLPDLRLWSDSKHKYILRQGPGPIGSLPEEKTPEELGCKIGDVLRCYLADPSSEERFKAKHFAGPGGVVECVAVYPQRKTQNASELEQERLRLAALKHRGEQQRMGRPIQKNTSKYLGSPERSQVSELQCAPIDWSPYSAPSDYVSSSSHAGRSHYPRREYGVETNEPVAHELTDCVDDDEEDSGSEEGADTVGPQVIETKNIKAMGLAAGGKLIQDIYKDPYPPTTWNHAAARILHIHILDPVSCEKVTHIVPAPPSTDVKAYTEAGGQYFVVEEKVDERLDGGDFDNVKSVSQMDQHIGITTEPEFDPTKPKMCTTCELRLCDCIIRPCGHQFCNICIKRIEQNSDEDVGSAHRKWKCPTCDSVVSHVAGFSAPMNLPGEEPLRVKVPVNVLKIEDGRMRFTSVQRSRV